MTRREEREGAKREGARRTRSAKGAKKLNAAWHRAHRMLKGATLQQRVRWHVAHTKACGCREMPKSVVEALRQRAKQ